MRYRHSWTIIVGFALATAPALAQEAAPAAAPIAEIDTSDLPYVKSLIGRATTRDGFTLRPDVYMEWGNSIVVGAGSEIEVVAPDFAIKAWGPTEFELKKTEKETNWVDLVYGRLISAFAKGSKSALSTRSNVAGIRGTVVYVEDTADQVDYTCVCEGDVVHKHKRLPDKRLVTKTTHHDEPFRAVHDGYVDAPMANHNDDDVAAVKALLTP